jgi:hypothetical protein
LVVELSYRATTWTVETFTERVSEPRRAKDKKENWRKGLSRDEAYDHLKDVFEGLLQ